MKKIKIILMFLLTLPLLGQAQKTWKGSISNDWDDPANWNPANVPTASDDVTIPFPYVLNGIDPVVKGSPASPAVCNGLTIEPGAVINIISGKALTVYGNLINWTKKGIIIESDENGTGSLIVNGTLTGNGTVVASRYMTTNRWHLVSSPLSGQTVANFLSSNIQIAIIGANRGMMDYNPAANIWNAYFINGSSYGNLEAGRGFSMRTTNNSFVKFMGTLQTGSQSVVVVPDKWNCIGNPYTSAIGITAGSLVAANFLTVNAANLDASYGAVYVWDQPDASNGQTGKYTTVSNVPGLYDNVQQGQAFFVKTAPSKTSVSFTSAMQIHMPVIPLKSTANVWPTIKLETTVGSQKSTTIIAFNSAMTRGLDPTYDAGLFKGGSDLIVYSRLIEDNGIPFAIQALPDKDYKTMIIPIGLDSKSGGDVVFSAELLNLPAECKVILEDKVTKTFTDLSKDNYKVAIVANSVISDRFQLHTSELISKLSNETSVVKLSAFAIRNTEIRVIGEVGNNAIARLYNLQGSVVQIENLKAGNLNVIATANIKNGIYMLSVEDQGRIQTFKLLIRE